MRVITNEFLGNVNNMVHYVEIALDSTETKPTTGIADGSIATETDTGDVYFFNEKTSAWVKQFSFQG